MVMPAAPMFVGGTLPSYPTQNVGYTKLIEEDQQLVGKETRGRRRTLLKRICCVVLSLFCCGVLTASISLLIVGVAVRNCTHPSHRSNHNFVVPIIPSNETQVVDIQSVSGVILVRFNQDPTATDVIVNVELGARSESSLREMELQYDHNQTHRSAVLTEKAKPFKLFHNCQISKYDVLLPKRDLSFVNLNIHSSTGLIDIKLDHTVVFNHVNITSHCGAIEIEGLSAKNITASLREGEIKIEKVNAHILKVQGKEANVKIEHVEKLPQAHPNDTLSLVQVAVTEGKVKIKGANDGNIVASLQKGELRIKVDSSKFHGSYMLKGKAKVKGQGTHVPRENSEGLKSGTIGQGTSPQSINASVGKGNIKLKIK